MAVASAAGLLYAAVGSIGAVIVAAVVPPLLGDTTPQAVAGLHLVRQIVFGGMWQTLGTIPWGVDVCRRRAPPPFITMARRKRNTVGVAHWS
jgi:hypothetical protein